MIDQNRSSRLVGLSLLALLISSCASDKAYRTIASEDVSLFPVEISQVRTPVKDAIQQTLGTQGSSSLADPEFQLILDPDHGNVVIGFSITNKGSPKVNPSGSSTGAFRQYEFDYPEQARQGESLNIVENANPNGDDSAYTMETSLTFFPRRYLPAMTDSAPDGQFEVILPTGESVLWDRTTKEIVGGALAETGPIDLSTNRIKRTFVHLDYSGGGIMIRSDQRGEDPRAAVVWGQKKQATITYGKSSCKVSPGDLWEQKSETFHFLFSTDEEFYDYLRTHCNWNVSDASFGDLPKPRSQIPSGK